jgi:glycerate kinase
VERGIHSVIPQGQTLCTPLADGGEGTLDTVAAARPGSWIRKQVTGPLPGRTVDNGYLFWPETGEALIEMARCAGLPLLNPSEQNPLLTTTRGVGEWMQDAVEHGATTITLALGGSATVDGGSGMARALGWRFLDENGEDLPEGGGSLQRLARILPPSESFPAGVRAMCDVTNPLLGPKGAAAVFGPQKGASPDQVKQLEEGLTRLANALREATGRDVAEIPGAGAAGGLGAGCIGFLGGSLVSGIGEMLRISGLDTLIGQADHVITGEGRVDSQSLDGKVLSGVLACARQHGIPVSVIAGSSTLSDHDVEQAGLSHALSANHQHLPLDEAIRRAAELAENAGRRLAREL